MFGTTPSSNEPARLNVEVQPPPPSKPTRKGFYLLQRSSLSVLEFVLGPASSSQQQFDPQSRETEHDKANLVVRTSSDA